MGVNREDDGSGDSWNRNSKSGGYLGFGLIVVFIVLLAIAINS